MRAFNDFLKRDRNKATVTRISELGLVEMTRKRTRESLLHNLTEPCAHCEGKGYTKSRRTIAYELMRELRRLGGLIEGDTVIIEVHPDVAQSLATTDRAFLEDMEKRLQKRIIVKARGSFHIEDFEIRSPGEKPLEKSELRRRPRVGPDRVAPPPPQARCWDRPTRWRRCWRRRSVRASTPRRWPRCSPRCASSTCWITPPQSESPGDPRGHPAGAAGHRPRPPGHRPPAARPSRSWSTASRRRRPPGEPSHLAAGGIESPERGRLHRPPAAGDDARRLRPRRRQLRPADPTPRRQRPSTASPSPDGRRAGSAAARRG